MQAESITEMESRTRREYCVPTGELINSKRKFGASGCPNYCISNINCHMVRCRFSRNNIKLGLEKRENKTDKVGEPSPSKGKGVGVEGTLRQ